MKYPEEQWPDSDYYTGDQQPSEAKEERSAPPRGGNLAPQTISHPPRDKLIDANQHHRITQREG